MKICLIAPGGTSVPPNGWGAVESIVWDYYENLTSRGLDVHIINEKNITQLVLKCNSFQPDIVHIMYDDHIVIAPFLQCKTIYYMSHYAYITQPDFEKKQHYYYNNIFKKVIQYQDYIIFNAISKEVFDVYKRNGYNGKYNILCNGARSDKFQYKKDTLYPNKSIYIAKIEYRKSQYKYQSISSIDFVGNYHNSEFDCTLSNYIGEWSKSKLYDNLTNYSNLVLLSNGEADPLVVKEALMAGLGVVISECSSANLDRNKDFITVIPNEKLDDINYIEEEIQKNREVSIQMREQIRKYALENFSWEKIIDRFLEFSFIQ
jgi:glycosyltransferase involved in cell wall biosynthesis